jgi:hypothetical protein
MCSEITTDLLCIIKEGWRKSGFEEFYNFFSSPSITTAIKLWIMIGLGQAQRTVIQEMPTKFGKPEIKCSFGHRGENGKIIIKLNLDQ